MPQYRLRVWNGDSQTGLLIARPLVKAADKLQALEKSVFMLLPLFAENCEEISFRVDLES